MDPSSPASPAFEVPASQPQGDTLPLLPTQEAPATPEISPMSTAPARGTPISSTAPLMPPPAFPVAPALDPAATSSHPTSPAVADDLDLIEKEWIVKAKAIVANTRTDPHAQNEEMNRFKADYLKKRYQKDIKVEN